MNDKIKINLQIADESFTMTINRDEEELFRKAAKQVNDRMNVYRSMYNHPEFREPKCMVQKTFWQWLLLISLAII